MAREHAYLCRSFTVNDAQFRVFALTRGCGDPDCKGCQLMSDHPVYAAVVRPEPERDEWALCMWP